ncbi:MAG: hypothetical protein RR623_09645 [Bacilli bacterium]
MMVVQLVGLVPVNASENVNDSINQKGNSNDLQNYIPFVQESEMPDYIKDMLIDAIENDLSIMEIKEEYKEVLTASDLEVLNEAINEPSERGLPSLLLKVVMKFVKKYGLKAACAYFSIQGAHAWLYKACRVAGWW